MAPERELEADRRIKKLLMGRLETKRESKKAAIVVREIKSRVSSSSTRKVRIYDKIELPDKRFRIAIKGEKAFEVSLAELDILDHHNATIRTFK